MVTARVDSEIFKFDLGMRISGGDPVITMSNRPSTIGDRFTKAEIQGLLWPDGTTYDAGVIPSAICATLDDDTGTAVKHGSADDRISCVIVAGGSPEASVPINTPTYDIAATSAEGSPETVSCKFGSSDMHIVLYTGATDPVPTAVDATGYLVCSATAGVAQVPSTDAIGVDRGAKVYAVDTTLKLAVIKLK